ncbi:helix-turn-helix transcriptional regulator [Marinobacter sp. S6332]|uniref:helix-turn-helix domain-containing protein n=1 Tax=Marinobacter sp. S6332 TaxID=2926403 RepID=UPI001FF53A93|nr:helix-turn-helix transcriptional regulator [Marinobacter sp. S6332]MCK0164266.1 helix-turn-helix domain-containing protein [Marinobacter sp. S6332]
MTSIEEGGANVYEDLGSRDAGTMLLKAQLAAQIRNIIRANQWTQAEACKVLDLTQSKLSNLLNGKFRGISETKMLECLTRLGRDVQIVIGAERRSTTAGRVSVVEA